MLLKSSEKFHVLVTILHTQNFIKIHQFVLKILNGNKILTSIKGHNCWKITKNNFEIVLTYILSISMHLQNFIKIHQLVHKILSINEILSLIKGHNSVENEQKILLNQPNLHLGQYQCIYTKFDRNPQINSQDIEHKQNSVNQEP